MVERGGHVHKPRRSIIASATLVSRQLIAHSQVVKLLVGNKIDKANREVTRADGIEFARNRGMVRFLLACFIA